MIGRWIGWAFIVLGLGLAGHDLLTFLNHGTLALKPLGQVWYSIHPGSLNLVQAVIERYVHPFLWDPIIFTVLRWPAAVVFLVPGLALVLLFRKRGWRRRKRRSRLTE